MISGGHPCRTSRPDSASSNLTPTSCNKAMPRHLRHGAGVDAKVVYSIDGRCCFTQYSWHPPCRDLTSVGDACTGAQFTTIFHGPALNAVRAYIHCNHLQSTPTTRASAPTLMATLTGAANPPWRITSLAPPLSPRPDATAYPYFLVTAIVRGVTAFTPLSTHHPAFVRPYREGCAHIVKYPFQSCFSAYSLLTLASLLFARHNRLINDHLIP